MLCAGLSLCDMQYMQPSVCVMFSLLSRTSSFRSRHTSLRSAAKGPNKGTGEGPKAMPSIQYCVQARPSWFLYTKQMRRCHKYIYIHIYIYIYIPERFVSSRNCITQPHREIILRDYITGLYYGITLQNHVTEL